MKLSTMVIYLACAVAPMVHAYAEAPRIILARIILASESEIRKKALNILGLTYETALVNVDENALRDEDPLKMALNISEAKARAVAATEEGIIIAGDAFLLFQGEILDKPHSLEEAYAMLHQLSGNKHTFVTGLAVYDTQTQKMRSSTAICDMYFRTLSHEEIVDYCNRNPVLKFAGAHDSTGVARCGAKISGACISETATSLKDLIQFLDEIAQDRDLEA